MRGELKYRADIDGLRAIAVVAVVLYHFGFGLPGGFVGVDIFFVISGFLITTLIWKEAREGNFSLLKFFERRTRRIGPALVVLLAVVLLSGFILLLPNDFTDLAKTTLAQLGFSSNILFSFKMGYFGPRGRESVLLHMWSLSVEEQFYLFLPLAILGLQKLGLTRRLRPLWTLMAGMVIGSLALSHYLVGTHPKYAYFILPTRAWELGVGSLIALVAASRQFNLPKAALEFGSLLGTALIIWGCFGLNESMPYPGLNALFPVLGAGLVIFAGLPNLQNHVPFANRLLGSRPFVSIGLVSYSWYLWHWPFLAILHAKSLYTPSNLDLSAVFIGSAAMGFLSYRYIELPFRNQSIASGRRIFAWAGAAYAGLAAIALAILVTDGFPTRFSPTVLAAIRSGDEKAQPRVTMSAEDVTSKNFVRLGDSSQSAKGLVLIWGDSHAMCALPGFDELFKSLSISGIAATREGAAPVIDWMGSSNNPGLNRLNRDFNRAVINYVGQQRPKAVILVGYWSRCLNSNESKNEFLACLARTIEIIRVSGAQPVLMLDAPCYTMDVAKVLRKTAVSGEDPAVHLKVTPTSAVNDGFPEEFLSKLRDEKVIVLNPKNDFRSKTDNRYRFIIDGHPLYFDENHITSYANEHILGPYLSRSLAPALRELMQVPRK